MAEKKFIDIHHDDGQFEYSSQINPPMGNESLTAVEKESPPAYTPPEEQQYPSAQLPTYSESRKEERNGMKALRKEKRKDRKHLSSQSGKYFPLHMSTDRHGYALDYKQFDNPRHISSVRVAAPPETVEIISKRSRQTYLILAALATLFCCPIPGIIATIYAAKGDAEYESGDYEEGARDIRSSKKWTLASCMAGVILLIFVITIFMLLYIVILPKYFQELQQQQLLLQDTSFGSSTTVTNSQYQEHTVQGFA